MANLKRPKHQRNSAHGAAAGSFCLLEGSQRSGRVITSVLESQGIRQDASPSSSFPPPRAPPVSPPGAPRGLRGLVSLLAKDGAAPGGARLPDRQAGKDARLGKSSGKMGWWRWRWRLAEGRLDGARVGLLAVPLLVELKVGKQQNLNGSRSFDWVESAHVDNPINPLDGEATANGSIKIQLHHRTLPEGSRRNLGQGHLQIQSPRWQTKSSVTRLHSSVAQELTDITLPMYFFHFTHVHHCCHCRDFWYRLLFLLFSTLCFLGNNFSLQSLSWSL